MPILTLFLRDLRDQRENKIGTQIAQITLIYPYICVICEISVR